ncbi:MAG: DUF3300 domain-containing protein [Colwellia sp.]
MKNILLKISLYITLFVWGTLPLVSAQEIESEFTDAELAQMLAPIALYPDSLLTHILIASTYPVEVIEAERWTVKHPDISADQAASKVENIDWEPSVKALVPFPRILKRLSEDLHWTRQLGDAFLQNETRLLQAIQLLRQQAAQAGSLEQMENMDISYEDNNIIIEPVKKEIVYVPYYDTRMVYGTWYWSSYPPVYWTPYYNVHVSRYHPFYWHSGIHISFNYYFSAFHWHNRHVVVINHHNTRYNAHGYNSHRYDSHRYNQRRLIVSEGYAKRWAHKPKHRKGVAYRTSVTKEKYRSSRPSVYQTNKRRTYERSLLASNQTKNRVSKSSTLSNRNRVYTSDTSNIKRTNKARATTKHQALTTKMNKSTSVRYDNNKGKVRGTVKHNKLTKYNNKKNVNKVVSTAQRNTVQGNKHNAEKPYNKQKSQPNKVKPATKQNKNYQSNKSSSVYKSKKASNKSVRSSSNRSRSSTSKKHRASKSTSSRSHSARIK